MILFVKLQYLIEDKSLIDLGKCVKNSNGSVLLSIDWAIDFRYVETPGGGYSHTLPIWVCAAQRGRDFEAPDLEWGIHFRGAF